jgi:hypothetical protein
VGKQQQTRSSRVQPNAVVIGPHANEKKVGGEGCTSEHAAEKRDNSKRVFFLCLAEGPYSLRSDGRVGKWRKLGGGGGCAAEVMTWNGTQGHKDALKEE